MQCARNQYSMMDVFSQLKLISPSFSDYAKRYNLSRMFQCMLEQLIVDRPEDPIAYLHELLKIGVHDIVRVLVIGSSTVELKLMSSSLELDMDLVHLTRRNLIEYTNSDLIEEIRKYENISKLPAKLWADVVKNRVHQADCLSRGWILENFPQTREQAFLLLKHGIYPTHIVVMEGDASSEKIKNLPIGDYVQTKLICDVFKYANIAHCSSNLPTADLILFGENFIRKKVKEVIAPLPRITLFGPLGSGKKTIAFFLADKYNLVQIRFTEVLRQAAMTDGSLKEQINNILSSTEPINDEFLSKVAADRLKQEDCVARGWIMYDFPNNVSQAEYFTQYLAPYQVNKAIFLEANFNTCLQRFKQKNKDCTDNDFVYTDEDIEQSFAAYQNGVSSLAAFFSRNLQDDITFTVNTESDVESVFDVVENIFLGDVKRHLPQKKWWEWSSRNSGIY